MKNLAGNRECDVYIEHELKRARIAIERVELPERSEVPYRMIGRLGPIEFRRYWAYWVANGPVPIEIAHRLYADPVGRTDIRVDGHCGCPEPEPPWTEIIDGAEYVMTYHIDSEIGLRVFADAVRGLIGAAP